MGKQLLNLLNYLNGHYFQQPMEGHSGNTPSPKPFTHKINGNDGQVQEVKDDKSYALRRARSTRQYSPARTIDDNTVIYRTNHGLAHTIRSIKYLPAIIQYLKLHGVDTSIAFPGKLR